MQWGMIPRFHRAVSDADSLRMTAQGHSATSTDVRYTAASLIGHSGSSTFRLSTSALSMSLAGSRFSSDSAPRPFHYGIRRRAHVNASPVPICGHLRAGVLDDAHGDSGIEPV